MSESNEAAKRAADEAFREETRKEAETLIETGFDPDKTRKSMEQDAFDVASRKEADEILAGLAQETDDHAKAA
jgi:hypothetical protein